MDGRYAAIDIGTVTCRMLVADVRGSRMETLAKEYRITNLGEGVDASHRLSAAAMERVAAAIDGFLAVRRAFDAPEDPIASTTVVATSAARDAENADAFEEMLASRGLRLHVASGAEEAALTFAGATCGMQGLRTTVVDVGGGSTEFSIGRGGNAPETAHSFDVGCRRVTERFLRSDPPAVLQLQEARDWVRRQFEEWFADAPALPTDRLVAVAGTATSAVSIREHMRAYDSARVHGAQVTLAELRRIEEKLAAVPLSQRRLTVGLDPGRAPVIVAGLLILEEALRVAGADSFTASENDILQGIVMKAAGLL